MANSIEKSRRQSEKRKAERHARGLKPRSGGRPRNNPLFLTRDVRKTGNPVGRPANIDAGIVAIKELIEFEGDYQPPPRGTFQHYDRCCSMQEDLEKYAPFLPGSTRR